jgi:hypothetical protein
MREITSRDYKVKLDHGAFADRKAAVASARRLFEAIQRLDWCRPDGMTKTQYVYREAAGTSQSI